ncbi:NAD(P)H-binding protein [Ectobacillus antri]|jgi:putative NADH-flavin reductase|uniref:NAD(P)H-binding protein n=1 Tax=Ectobacillus antri TaxID=2486280 RepID=A0ABT6H2F6_9BACI|nr:NAD(P)H-binding protein [Ectobacillus antri]MDG4656273.1 NAD(P)H-binding protein [Ectobacillus antri]MDG5752948.1 NAD(P)H-binding protein [Ectobacillus antri]
MRICIFGATGRTGKEIMRLSLQDHHQITALVRGNIQMKEQVTCITGDACNREDIQRAVCGSDVVISALGTDGVAVLSQSMPFIIEAMKQEGISRIVTVGTAGILQARTNPKIYRFQSGESKRKSTHAAEDHLRAYLELAQSDLDWTIVCPTHLIDGEARGGFRTEAHMLPEHGKQITVGDTALFTYQQLTSSKYNRKRVGIAY